MAGGEIWVKYKQNSKALRKVQPQNTLSRKVLESPLLQILKGRRPSVRESSGIIKKKKSAITI